jgi:hypothetical protein
MGKAIAGRVRAPAFPKIIAIRLGFFCPTQFSAAGHRTAQRNHATRRGIIHG